MKTFFVAALMLATTACSQTAADHAQNSAPRAPHARSSSKVVVPKRELARANVGPTAVQIDADPGKWTGSYVRLSCEIIKVFRGPGNAPAVDARCGRGVVASLENYPSRAATREYNRELGDQALLALVGDGVSNLGAGQSVGIVGRVTGSSRRKSGTGRPVDVVTVRVDYID
jgi:hypothetical protein